MKFSQKENFKILSNALTVNNLLLNYYGHHDNSKDVYIFKSYLCQIKWQNDKLWIQNLYIIYWIQNLGTIHKHMLGGCLMKKKGPIKFWSSFKKEGLKRITTNSGKIEFLQFSMGVDT